MNLEDEGLTLAQLAKEYSDEGKARAFLESRLWPQAPICPHCGSKRIFRLKASSSSKSGVRGGVLKCSDCRKQFTVTVGTIFEKTHVPISKWILAIFVLCSAKKGISAHQLHRSIGVTYKTAWFMFHRLRHAMKQKAVKERMKGTVEADDVYIGGTPEPGKGTSGRGTKHKTPVVALVERGDSSPSQDWFSCVLVEYLSGSHIKGASRYIQLEVPEKRPCEECSLNAPDGAYSSVLRGRR